MKLFSKLLKKLGYCKHEFYIINYIGSIYMPSGLGMGSFYTHTFDTFCCKCKKRRTRVILNYTQYPTKELLDEIEHNKAILEKIEQGE